MALLGSRTELAAHSSYRPGRKPAALWSFNPAGQDLRPEKGGPGVGQVRRAGEPVYQSGAPAASEPRRHRSPSSSSAAGPGDSGPRPVVGVRSASAPVSPGIRRSAETDGP